MLSAYGQSEDNLVGALMVVGIEQFAIVRLKRVAHVHHLLASLLTLGILSHASIGLAVEVELGKQSVGSALRSLAIRTCRGRKHVAYAVLQFAFDIVEGLLCGVAWRNIAAHGVVLGHHRDVAEEVEGVIVEQCAHKTCLSLIHLHLLSVSTREVGAVGIAQEFVAECDVVIYTIVHVRHPSVVGIP